MSRTFTLILTTKRVAVRTVIAPKCSLSHSSLECTSSFVELCITATIIDCCNAICCRGLLTIAAISVYCLPTHVVRLLLISSTYRVMTRLCPSVRCAMCRLEKVSVLPSFFPVCRINRYYEYMLKEGREEDYLSALAQFAPNQPLLPSLIFFFPHSLQAQKSREIYLLRSLNMQQQQRRRQHRAGIVNISILII